MELCVHDRITEHPTADDITRAIDAAPRDEEWFITLESDRGAFLEAFAEADGAFRVAASVRDVDYEAAAPVDAATLKTIFVKFSHGDASWRAECPWKETEPLGSPSRPVPARDTSSPPQWAIGVMVGTIVVVGLIFYFSQGRQSIVRSYLPFGDSDYFYIGLIFLPMIMLVIVALVSKLIEVRRASVWQAAAGKVVKSGVEARHHRFAGAATTVSNVPVVEYEFSARGRTWRGSRISIGEDSGGANTEATMKRYRAGAAVTVYYDPNDPGNCVLEREPPKGMGKGCSVAAALLVAFVAGGIYLATNASRLIEIHLPKAQAPVMVFATCFGLVLLLFFFAHRRMAQAAANWPSVPGKVVASGTEAYEKHTDGRTRTHHVPAVEFAYRVNGIEYRSRQIKLGVTVEGSQRYADRVAARYPQGSNVKVRYDPSNPTNAVLEHSTGYGWILLLIALFCFGVAVFASGVFR